MTRYKKLIKQLDGAINAIDTFIEDGPIVQPSVAGIIAVKNDRLARRLLSLRLHIAAALDLCTED